MPSSDCPANVRDDRITRRKVLRLAALTGAGVAGALLLGCRDEEKARNGSPTSSQATAITVPPSGFFDSNGVKIHYETVGEGPPIVLVHGFSASFQTNWGITGWIDTLKAVRRVVGIDCRGHGLSDKPHDPEAYTGEMMRGDVVGLMDHLGIDKADLFGYSMGAYLSAALLAHSADRFDSVILGGIGNPFPAIPPEAAKLIADALLTDDPSTIKGDIARTFRAVAEANPNNDLEALAACIKSFREPLSPSDYAGVSNPVLIVDGADDILSQNPQVLADAISGAKVVLVPDRDHLTVLTDQRFKDEVVAFLKDTT